jgi:hypothetical protein
MIINRLTEIYYYVSCTINEENTSAKKTTWLLINHVWKSHEFSSIIIFDRKFQFVSLIWKTICKTLKIDVKLSTAFHSETNDQSEIVNQKMKRYLRLYCNYQQDDWLNWLSIIEFVFNAVTSTFIEWFVFMTNYDFESRMSFKSSDSDNSQKRLSAKEQVLTQKTRNIAEKMKNIWNFIKKTLINAQKIQKNYANKKRKNSFDTR